MGEIVPYIQKYDIQFKLENKKVPNFDNVEIKYSEVVLTMITVEGRLSNIYFAKETIVDSLDICGNIVKIGTNYNEIKDPNYDKLIEKPKKSNRGRKPKIKQPSKRKQQGTEKYFHSQVTFTFHNKEQNKFYQFKLFVNGSFQIPCITNEDIESIKYKAELTEMIEYLQQRQIFRIDKDKQIDLLYLISILNNYRVNLEFINPLNPYANFHLDIIKFKTVMERYQDDNNVFTFKLMYIMYNPAKFTGLQLIFYTPREYDDAVIQNKVRINTKANKNKTTIIIFGSCKINVSSVSGRGEVIIILNDLHKVINLFKEEIFYYV